MASTKGPNAAVLRASEMHRRPSVARVTEYAATKRLAVPVPIRATDGAQVAANGRPPALVVAPGPPGGPGQRVAEPGHRRVRAGAARSRCTRSVEVVTGRFSAATVVEAA